MSKCCVYQIVNKINHKVYVGSTNDISSRWRQHKSMLKKGTHHSHHLQCAFRKYGEDAFNIEILEKCDVKELRIREKWWIDYTGSYKDGYNLTANTDNPLDDPEVRKKALETLKREGKGFYNPEASKKGVETHKRNGTGFYNPKTASAAGKKGGKEAQETLKREGKGFYNPKVLKEIHEAHKRNGTGFYNPKVLKEIHEACKREGKGFYNPKTASAAGKKGQEAHKRNGTGFYNPKTASAAGKKGLEAQKREGKGFFNPKVLKEIHEAHKRNGTGFYNPKVLKEIHEACKRDRIRRGHEIVQYLFSHGLEIDEENFNKFRPEVHPYTNIRRIPTYEWFSRNKA